MILKFLFLKEKSNSPFDISASGKISLIFCSKFICQGNFLIYLLSISKLLLIESISLRSRVFSILTQPLNNGISSNKNKEIININPF